MFKKNPYQVIMSVTIKYGIINVYKFPAYLNKPYVTVQISCPSDS